jgi:hypothetical protein
VRGAAACITRRATREGRAALARRRWASKLRLAAVGLDAWIAATALPMLQQCAAPLSGYAVDPKNLVARPTSCGMKHRNPLGPPSLRGHTGSRGGLPPVAMRAAGTNMIVGLGVLKLFVGN